MRERRRTFSEKEPGDFTVTNATTGALIRTNPAHVPRALGNQYTLDSQHDIRSLRRGQVSWDIGGPFYSVKKEYESTGPVIKSTWRSTFTNEDQTYKGPVSVTEVLPARWNDANYLGTPSTQSQLDAFGTTAISRTIPTAPSADLSVFLGELLREGVPKVVGAAALKNKFRNSRDIGGEYLNVQFGWLPFVSELRDISAAIASQEKRFAQLMRDSGRLVRRRFDWPIEVVSSPVNTAAGYYPWPQLAGRRHYNVLGSAYSRHSVSKRRWFSGAYTFHFELPDKQHERLADQAKKARILLGLDLTPAVVWNLAPWSWLADWVTNTGDVLTNVSSFNRDDLVLRYGYIMEEVIRESVYGLNRVEFKDFEVVRSQVGSMEDKYTTTIKNRSKATPYGFGLNTSGFSPKQWSILGALGIARAPNVLR